MTPELVQSNLNVVWTLVAGILVFTMQAGFALVETGFTRAKTESTTRTPATRPIAIAAFAVTRSHGAVMATRPASEPLSAIVRSGLPMIAHAVASAATVPAQAARFVVIATRPMEPTPAV